MIRKSTLKSCLLACWLMLSAIAAFAHGGNDPVKDKKDPKSGINKPDKEPTTAVPVVVDAEMQFQLDNALAGLNKQLASNAVEVDKMLDLPLNISADNITDRDKASSMFSYLDQNPDKVKAFISFEDLVTLPIGLKQTLNDNTEVALGIYSVEYTPTEAKITVFVRVKMKVNDPASGLKERILLLGSNGVSFTRTGGLGGGGNFDVGLLGDYPVPMKNWTVVFKGVCCTFGVNVPRDRCK